MTFYQSVLGGELTMSTFGEMPEAVGSEDAAEPDKIMHAVLTTEGGLTLMAADTPSSMEYTPGGSCSLSLSGEDDGELRGYWAKLSDGGVVNLPLERAPWGDSFGMCVDRFGVSWMVNIVGTS